MRHTLIFLLLIAVINVKSYAQRTEVITSSGDFFKNSIGSISWTLGELSIETYSAQSKILTQGFQQTNSDKLVTGLSEWTDLMLEAYPNPAVDELFIHTSSPSGLSYQLLDLVGKPISQRKLTTEETSIPLMGLAPAMYLLEIRKDAVLIKIFRIIKK